MAIIECLLKRLGGSHIELGEQVYHFAPNEKDDHVCAVEHEDHISILLSIPEGYRVYGEEPVVPTVNLTKLQAGDADPIDNGQSSQLDQTTLGDQGSTDLNTSTSTETKEPQAELTAEQELEQLRALYLERFGKKPHHAMGLKRLREELGMDEE